MSPSTMSVSTDTAIVVSFAVALTDGSVAEVAVIVVSLVLPLAADAGTPTLTQRSTPSPGCTVAVALSGVVHVASKICAVQVLEDDSAYESARKPALVRCTEYVASV